MAEDDLSSQHDGVARRVAIYPGTFDPIHNGHVDIARRAAGLFDEVVVAVYERPAKHVLFATAERIALAEASLGTGNGGCRISVESYSTLTVQYARARGATAIVRGLRALADFEYEYQMTTMNQQLEPAVETVFLMTSQHFAHLSSTIVKEVAAGGADIAALVPPPVRTALARRLAAGRA